MQNGGAAGSKASTTRYYLSLDAVKGAGDALLTGGRSIPALAPGACHSRIITVTIPTGMAPRTTLDTSPLRGELGSATFPDLSAAMCLDAARRPSRAEATCLNCVT